MKGRIRPRALITGIIMGLAICAVSPYNNAYLGGVHLSGRTLPPGPLLHPGVDGHSAFRPVWRASPKKHPIFTGLELLEYLGASWWWSRAWATPDLVRTFFVNLTAPYYFASYGNRWSEVLAAGVAGQALYPASPEAVEVLYNGMEGGRDMGFFELLGHISLGRLDLPAAGLGRLHPAGLFCDAVPGQPIFSRQWVVNERVNFPLMRVPQLMAQAFDEQWLYDFFLNRFFLCGLLASRSACT
jgi:hypothetical protein